MLAFKKSNYLFTGNLQGLINLISISKEYQEEHAYFNRFRKSKCLKLTRK